MESLCSIVGTATVSLVAALCLDGDGEGRRQHGDLDISL